MKRQVLLVVLSLALPATALAQIGEELAWKGHSHARFGAGWYASPGDGVGLDGYTIAAAYHYNLGNYALIGPTLQYTGLKASSTLQDLPNIGSSFQTATNLRITQVRVGVKAIGNPGARMVKMKLPIWPYGGIDTGLAISVVGRREKTEAAPGNMNITDGSGDWYLRPLVGVMFAPKSPIGGFLEMGYLFVPTYKFMDKSFNYYGAPTSVQVPLNTDGFTLDAGLFYQF